MTPIILERLIQSYLATDQPVYSFGWQGGEPTLMGLDFFQRVTELQQRHGRSGAIIGNGLQTNATLITKEMAAHFSRYRFLAGCSLDGPADVHDRYRRTACGAPSHADVLRGIAKLREWRVEFNILVLVSQANVGRAREVYRYLTDHDFLYQQYIPCVEFAPSGQLQPYAITGPQWGEFICELFDEWYPADIHRVSIRHFDAILARLVHDQTTVCTLADNCCQYFVVEHNGDIYPCDFFVEPRLKIGNVLETSWEDALRAPNYRTFGAQKSRRHKACTTCEFLRLCQGDCLKHRLRPGHSAAALSWLCTGWRQFFEHTRDRFETLAAGLRAKPTPIPTTARSPAVSARPGRNAPCPCGSGKKFKKCCGR